MKRAKKVQSRRRDRPARRALVIAGMHRTGTSAITRAFAALGAELPNDPLAPQADNELGFWESSRLHAVHEELLTSIGSSWHDVSPVPPSWFGSDAAIRYRYRLVRVLEEVYSSGGQLLAIKDPRICRLVPLWRSVLEDFGAEALWVLTVRNPLEVAFSLRARNGFPLAKSLLLWLRHLLDAEVETRGAQRTVVSFEALLEDCNAAMGRIGRDLNLTWPRSTHAAQMEAEGSLSPAHRHQKVRVEELKGHPDVRRWVRDAYEAARRLEAGNATATARLDRVRESLNEADAAFGPLVAGALGIAEEAQGRARRADEEARRLAEQSSAHEAETARLQEAVSARSMEIESLAAQQELEQAELKRLQVELEKSLDTLQRERSDWALERADREHRQVEQEKSLDALQRERSDWALERTEFERVRAEQEQALDALQRERSDWIGQREALEVQAAKSAEALAEATRHVEALAATEALAYREIELLQRSRSWRVTRPFRVGRVALALARILAAGFLRLRPGRSLGLRILSSPRRLRAAFVILESGLFDPAYYLRRHPDVRAMGVNPFLHFIAVGWREGRDPNPLFETAFYLERYPDVARSGADPLSHFVLAGAAEGRDPHTLFATRYYLEQLPRPWPAVGNPLQHYLRFGSTSVRSPHPLFDSRFYLAHNPDVRAAGINPLVHYLECGAAEGRDPSPRFSTRQYLSANKDVADAGVNPLVHFARCSGREGSAWPADSGSAGIPVPARAVTPQALTLRAKAATPEVGGPPTILCVSHVLPYPPRAGNAYRIHRMLGWLRQAGYRVVLVLAPMPGEEVTREDLLANAGRFGNAILVRRDNSIEYSLPDLPGVLAAIDGRQVAPLAGVLGENCRTSERDRELLAWDRTFCHDAVAAVTAHLQGMLGRCVVLAEYIWMTRLFPLLGSGALKVVDTVDVFSLKRQKVGEFGVRDLEVHRSEEAERLEKADIVLAIQDEERLVLKAIAPGRPVVTVGVDFDITVATPIPRNPHVLLVGSGNAQNVRGLRDFLRFAWPWVLEQVTDAQLVVAGPISEAVSVPAPGVRLVGPVADLGPLYRDCRVVINPVIGGTGLKIKTVEALCHGRPVVTWPAGVEGLPTEIASLCRTAEDWHGFQCRVTEALQDTALAGFSPAEQARVAAAMSSRQVYAPLSAILDRFFGTTAGAETQQKSGHLASSSHRL